MPNIQHRRGTVSAWATSNPVLLASEIGYETDTGNFKLGDGTTAWSSLPYGDRTAVKHNTASQGLTATQQSNARTNIGAASSKALPVFSVAEKGAVGTWDGGTGADDTTPILATITAAQAFATAFKIDFAPLPSGKFYKMTSPFPNISGMHCTGQSREASRIMFVGCSMLTIGSSSVKSMTFEDLGFYASTTNHLIDLGSSQSGDFYWNDFVRCRFYSNGGAISWINQNQGTVTTGGNFLENRFTQCDFDRDVSSTVPGINLVNNNGAVNGNVWDRCRFSSHNCTSSPAVKIEGTSASTYLFNNRFINCVGEQNAGGFIHAYTIFGITIEDCADYDATVTYTDHVFKISTSGSLTIASWDINVVNSGRYGGTLGAGIYDIWVNSSGTTVAQVVNIRNPTVYPGRPKIFAPQGQTIIWGDAGSAFPTDTRFVSYTGAYFNPYISSSAMTIVPANPSGRGLDLREGDVAYAGNLLHGRKFSDTGDRWVSDGAGKHQWGGGNGSFDTNLYRYAYGTLCTDGALKVGRDLTGNMPPVSTVGQGSLFYDTTLGLLKVANATVWNAIIGIGIRANVAVDPPSIAATSETNVTVTVTGAAVGMNVTAAPRTMLAAGLGITGVSVTAANTVTIRIRNFTASAVDDTSRTWDFCLWT